MLDSKKIRNFAIIAHIDHGKSTLTDRLLEKTGTVTRQSAKMDRITDTLELEQKKGITIKLQPVTMKWQGYILNLIDTPGHIDFNYEVSRSLSACEGAILLIDASQGIQAQTIANVYLAFEHDLTIIPVLSKIDLPNLNIPHRLAEIEEVLGFSKSEILQVSGKDGSGVEVLLQQIINLIPPPTHPSATNINQTITNSTSSSDNLSINQKKLSSQSSNDQNHKIPKTTLTKKLHSTDQTTNNLQALIFDSFYDNHQGVIAAVRLYNQGISTQTKLFIKSNQQIFTPLEVGHFHPQRKKSTNLYAGEVGYIATGLKDINLVNIGDTFVNNLQTHSIIGYKKPTAVVFASIYPVDRNNYLALKNAIAKLALNDAALDVSQASSNTLGQGFRGGFLGPLHLEITKQRLSLEHNVETIFSIPNVNYEVTMQTGKSIPVRTAEEFPDPSAIQKINEPWVKLKIITPQTYASKLIEVTRHHRGEFMNSTYLSQQHLSGYNYQQLDILIPFAELLKNIFSEIKSRSHGYASFNYTPYEYRSVDLVKVKILINHEDNPSLSFLETREQARSQAIKVLKVLKAEIHRHLFAIPLQAAIGATVIARENISAARKDVTAKLYGGDYSRKKKLLEKQKKGKKLLQQSGRVTVPNDVFIKIITS